MKNIFLLFLTCLSVYAQRGVSYDNVSRNVLQTNLNQAFNSITNNLADPLTLAGFNSQREIVSTPFEWLNGTNLYVPGNLTADVLSVGTLILTNHLDASMVDGVTEETQDAIDSINQRIDDLTGGYTIAFFGPPAGLNWGDGQTYHFGHDTVGAINTFTGFDKSAFPVDQGGTITSVTIFIASTVGDTNRLTMSLDINNGSTVLLVTSDIDLSVSPYRLRVGGLNQTVASGDLITARFLCPTWPVANPTTIRPYVTAFVRPPL